MVKIYRVRVEFEVYVAAEDCYDAENVGASLVEPDVGDGNICTNSDVVTLESVNGEEDILESLPFNGDGESTVRQYLEKSP